MAVVFTLSTFPYEKLKSYIKHQPVNTSLTFNIQSIIWLAFPSSEATIDSSLPPSEPFGVTTDYLIDDSPPIQQPVVDANDNEDLI